MRVYGCYRILDSRFFHGLRGGGFPPPFFLITTTAMTTLLHCEAHRILDRLILALIDVRLACQQWGFAMGYPNKQERELFWLLSTHGWILPIGSMPDVFGIMRYHNSDHVEYCRRFQLTSASLSPRDDITDNGLVFGLAVRLGMLADDYDPERHLRVAREWGRSPNPDMRYGVRVTPEGERLLKLRHRALPWLELTLSRLICVTWRITEVLSWRYGRDRHEESPYDVIARAYADMELPAPPAVEMLSRGEIPESMVVTTQTEIDLFNRLIQHTGAPLTVEGLADFCRRHYDELFSVANMSIKIL